MSPGGIISQTSHYCSTLKILSFTNGENNLFLFFPLSYRNTSLSKYTWHTFKYLKQPPDGLYLCNWTDVTGRHTTVYTEQFYTISVLENAQNLQKLHSYKNINRKLKSTEALYCFKSCIYRKSMLGSCSRKKLTGNKTPPSIHGAGV